MSGQVAHIPHTVFIISIDQQLRSDTTTTTLWLTAKLNIFHEAVIDELSLNITTAVQGGAVLSPTDTLTSYTPLSASNATGTEDLNSVHRYVCGRVCVCVCVYMYMNTSHRS